jgi:hypothetical protein
MVLQVNKLYMTRKYMSVYKKLQQARIKLQSVEMKKSGHNKFAGYHYFELGDFLLPIQQIFNEIGLCGVVSFTKEAATLRIIDIEATDQQIEFTSPMGSAALKGCHEVQNIGAVETYQRRYLYVTALEIVEHDALEAVAGKPEVPKLEKPQKSVAQDEFDRLSGEDQQMLRDIAMEVISYLTKENVEDAIDYIEAQELGELKIALWSLFDSKQRSTMKNYTQQKKAV